MENKQTVEIQFGVRLYVCGCVKITKGKRWSLWG